MSLYVEMKNLYDKGDFVKLQKIGSSHIELFRDSNRIDPDHAECCRFIMLSYLNTGEKETAHIWKTLAFSIAFQTKNHNVLIALMVTNALKAYSLLKNPKESLAILSEMEKMLINTSLDRSMPPAPEVLWRMLHEKRGFIYSKQNKFDTAIEEYEKALKHVSSDTRGRYKVECAKIIAEYKRKIEKTSIPTINALQAMRNEITSKKEFGFKYIVDIIDKNLNELGSTYPELVDVLPQKN